MTPIANFSPIAELARIVVAAARSQNSDIHSLDVLSELSGLSRRAFQNRCQAAGLTARNCLHFVQCLRAIVAADEKHWDPAALIPVLDPRTLRKVLSQAGMTGRERPTIVAFVSGQRFCSNPAFKESVLATLGQAFHSHLNAL